MNEDVSKTELTNSSRETKTIAATQIFHLHPRRDGVGRELPEKMIGESLPGMVVVSLTNSLSSAEETHLGPS